MNNPDGSPNFAALRLRMIRDQIEARGIRDAALLDAMRQLPREDFVPTAQQAYAYDDGALAIEHGQTISQPFITAYMVEALQLRTGDRALEVGTGSGYAAAVLGEIAAEVHSIERIPALAEAAAHRLRRMDYEYVHVHCGDGSLGLREEAPFDAILVTAGGPDVPTSLLRQLGPGGRLVMPIGDIGDQHLVRVRRTGLEDFERKELSAVRFVPLIGAEGWQSDPR